MAKKKKLVNNFQEIIDSGDLEAFKRVFDKCEITATGRGKTTCNAFSYRNLTPEHIQFLIDRGLEVNTDCGFGYPAVAFHASNKENLKCLLKNGADINYVAVYYRENALARACSTSDAKAVKNLLEENASIDVVGGIEGKTLLEMTLAHCDTIDIPNALAISKMLIEAGGAKTDKITEYVQKIGERFEFIRENISKDIIDELSTALDELYKIFDVSPVPRRIMHDGTGKILVKETRWQKQYEELWNMLVPGRGKAKTIQGEMIRIIGKISHEILDNGGINWEEDHKRMLHALKGFVNLNKKLEVGLIEEANDIINHITISTEEKTLDRLTEIIVKWVVEHSEPLSLGEVNYKR